MGFDTPARARPPPSQLLARRAPGMNVRSRSVRHAQALRTLCVGGEGHVRGWARDPPGPREHRDVLPMERCACVVFLIPATAVCRWGD